MFNLFRQSKTPKISSDTKPVILLVLDGFGLAPPSEGNAITLAHTPNYDSLLKNFPHGQLIASGESVGLPANEEGNSEVGHLTIGAGRVVFQSIMRINSSIEDSSFFENEAFLKAVEHVRKHASKLHLMGLVSSGEVHSSLDHFYALLDFCQKQSLPQVFLHLFTDGRDAPPHEAKQLITQITKRIAPIPQIQIATVSGRYYTMDRDGRWERTQKAYQAMVLGRGVLVTSPLTAVEQAYAQGQTDEFIEPSVIVKPSTSTNPSNSPVATISNNDAVIFFNFRIDRPRQLTMAFTLKDFENLKDFKLDYDPYREEDQSLTKKRVLSGPTFNREYWPQNLFFVSMTEFQKNIPVSAIAFPPISVKDSISFVLSQNNLKHLHLTESEKERMVTYYFNGMLDASLPGEEVLIIPSPKVATYDKKPQMSVHKIVKQFVKAVSLSVYHFYIINFANPDMVGHSGNLKATIKAIEETDKALGQVVSTTLKAGGTLIITADHGNAEELIEYPIGTFFYTTSKGETNTSHSNNPVPVIIVAPHLQGQVVNLPQGTLSDIAPTILSIMNLPIPQTMTGKNLLQNYH